MYNACSISVETSYICINALIPGKPEGAPDEYYVTGTDEYTKYLINNVIRVAGEAALRGTNISLDRYLTSMTIADWLVERNIAVTGTMRSDRKGIPAKVKRATGTMLAATLTSTPFSCQIT